MGQKKIANKIRKENLDVEDIAAGWQTDIRLKILDGEVPELVIISLSGGTQLQPGSQTSRILQETWRE